jgi:hypothetical protein
VTVGDEACGQGANSGDALGVSEGMGGVEEMRRD